MTDPIRVLYAEDNPHDADLTQARFAQAGDAFQLDRVDTGEACLARASQATYDVLLLDYRLPDMDGLDLLKRLMLANNSALAVMVTGLGDEAVVVQALRLGASDYVPKSPDYLDTLPDILINLVREARLRPAPARLVSAARRQVLYVERHTMDIDLTVRHLAEAAPHLVLTVTTACEDALRRLTQSPDFDLVLVDLRMTDMSALDFMREIKHRGWRIPVIVISGQGDEETAVAALKLGAADYLVKRENYLIHLPFAIEHAIEQHQLDQTNVELRREIIERQRAEDARRETEERFRLAFDTSPDAININRLADGLYVDINSGFTALTGFTRQDTIGKTSAEINIWHNPVDRQRLVQSLQAAGYCENLEAQFRRKDGSLTTALMSARIIMLQNVPHILSITRDITERKQADEALRASEERNRTILQTAMDGFWVVDTQGRLLELNEAYCKMSGYSAAELLNLRIPDLEVAEAREDTAAHIRKIIALGEDRFETQHRRKDGSVFDVEVSVQYRPDNGGRMSAFLRDITDRKLAEAVLQRYTQRLENLHAIDRAMLQAQSPQAIAEAALQRIERLIPSQRVSIVAYNPPIDEGLVLAEIDHDASPRAIGPRLSWSETYGPRRSDLQRGQPIIMRNVLARVKESPAVQTLALAGIRRLITMPLLAHDQLVGVLNLASSEAGDYSREQLDIIQEVADQLALALHQAQLYEQIQRHAAELETRVAERTTEVARERERLRAILDAAGDGMVFTNLDGSIEYINPAMEQLTGYTLQEALGQNPRVWQGGQTARPIYDQLWTTITDGGTWRGEMINRRRDGTLYDAALTVAPLHDADRGIVGFVGALRDITHQKELDRLKDQFVSNVSHELRTPLTSILLQIELLSHGKLDKRDHYLAVLQRETERLKKMIEDLLDLSRLDRQVTPIELVALDVHELAGQLLADRATAAAERQLILEFRPTAAAPLVLGEISSLTQVISNLITNALNYTPAGGCVTVQTHEQRAAGQDWLTVTVRDTGPGIAAQELPQLFKRFYRGEVGRRASAAGTGLGLAISQEIMKRLGGRITVESEPGQGAAFTAWLKPAR